jgi:surface antigen
MLRALVLSGLLAVAPVAILSTVPASAQTSAPQKCADTAEKKAKRSMFGSMLGSIGGSLLGRAGTAGEVISLAMPAASYLSDELLKMLDCKEQQQAAKATDEAMRGGVGTEVSWKSDTRPNVTGKSKVTGEEKLADGGQCLTVTDVVIVDGEETTVPKKMCRARGASGYAKV